MSIFYRDAVSQSIFEKGIDPELEPGLAEARRGFASSYLDHVEVKREDSFFYLVHPFSQLIFTYLGFSMDRSEVTKAWEPITARVNLSGMVSAILEPSDQDSHDRFLKVFDYIEVISLEGGILARLHGDPKVLPVHMNVAFSRHILWCPFKLRGC
jgi:hypothetical protein